MKYATDIIKYGKPKPYFDKEYDFNTIDIETIDNELFLIGVYDREYHYTLDNFYIFINRFLVECVQHNKDVLSWSRYDNTFIIKSLLSVFTHDEQLKILERVNRITPIFEYDYDGFHIEITNIIKENVIFTITDADDHKKKVTIYNIKNLYDTDLETTAANYKIDYYSKMGDEFHIIDRRRFNADVTYRSGVIKSNELDNRVLLDIATNLLIDFEMIAGVKPKTIYTAGSLARSYLLTMKDINFNFKSLMGKSPHYDKLLDYAMSSYHGGKIESYILGYLPTAKLIDITSAYPYALSQLPKLTGTARHETDVTKLKDYFYAFINCQIRDVPSDLIHPVTIPSPINMTNLSPCGTFETIITKPEYDYLIGKGIDVMVYDFIGIDSEPERPYYDMIHHLFNERMKTKKTNPSLSALYKLILNSLYGITYELTDQYFEKDDDIYWKGYRAGDFFNPIIASYITAMTRTYLSAVSQNIIDNGGSVYLNMTDSIIYNGEITLDIFSDVKTLGKFESPEIINDVMILGAGRYEYYNDFKKAYTIKSRGFAVKLKDKAFYKDLDLTDDVTIKHRTLVTFFKATTAMYGVDKLGHLVDDDYVINPLNLGGKRIITNLSVDLKHDYTTTRPIELSLDILWGKDDTLIKPKDIKQFKVKTSCNCVMCGNEISPSEYAWKYKSADGWAIRCLDHKPRRYDEWEPFKEGHNPDLQN